MHTGPVPGDYVGDWKPVSNPDFKCSKCRSHNIVFMKWESSCGGYEDIKYHCKGCGFRWWVEGPDA